MVMSSESYKYLTPWTPNYLQLPKITVVTCFIQSRGKFLVLQRARKDKQYKLWGIPGGKLDLAEAPLAGLIREVAEETTINLTPYNSSIKLLNTALSLTPSDGQYGLFLYHVKISPKVNVKINLEEHYAFRWVSLEEFESLDLLTAQGEAFYYVKDKLLDLIKKKQRKTIINQLIYG